MLNLYAIKPPYDLLLTSPRLLAIPHCLRHTRRSRHIFNRHTCSGSSRPLLPRQTRQCYRYCDDRRIHRWDHLSADAGFTLFESRLGLGNEDSRNCFPRPLSSCESTNPCSSQTIISWQRASRLQDIPPAGLCLGHHCRLLPRMGPIRPCHVSD